MIHEQDGLRNRERCDIRPRTARFPQLVDVCVTEDNEVEFLVKVDGRCRFRSDIEVEGRTFEPPRKDQLPWLMPRRDRVTEYLNKREDPAALFGDLVAYLKRCSELPTAQHYILVAAWIFHTYVMEWWHYSPYLLLDGPPEHGKTRTGKATIYAARRGVHTETLRAPNLIRDARDRGATILLDVMYVWRKAERLGCEDILLQRFERGAKAGRVLHPDRGPFDDTEYYDIFGPTVIATNESVHGILGTRCIPINLPYSTQRFESLDPEDGLPFRERLTAWRARVFDQQSALSENPAAGRLGDILQPLATIIDCVAADERPAFDRIVEELEDRQRQERSDTVEARILKVLLELTEHVRRGYLALSYITSQLNLAPETIGRRLRCLGLTTEKRTGGRMYLRWNERAIERLAIKYGVLDAD